MAAAEEAADGAAANLTQRRLRLQQVQGRARVTAVADKAAVVVASGSRPDRAEPVLLSIA